MSTSPASSQVLFSTVPIVTCSSLHMHVRDKSTCNKIPCTLFQVKRVSNTRVETACDTVPHCALCTEHQAHAAMLHVCISSHSVPPTQPTTAAARSAAAVVGGVGGPAGAWQHASSPCIHVLHTCAESNKIAGHVSGTRTGDCPKEQIYPIMHGTSPAHPQENTKLPPRRG